MKTGINAWSIEGSLDFEATFKAASEAGFDGIELNVDRSGAHSLTLDTSDADLKAIRELSERYKLPVSSISTSLWGGSMGTDSKASRELSERLMDRQLHFARELGASCILAVPGGITDENSMPKAFAASRETLLALAPMIKDYGIEVGLENVWNGFFTSPFDMLRFAESIDSPLVKIYYDIGNTIAFSKTEDWVEVVGASSCAMHIKGYRRNAGLNGGGVWCNISDSNYNWSRVRAALDSVGYDGYVSAEVGKYDAEQPWSEYYAMVRKEIDDIIK